MRKRPSLKLPENKVLTHSSASRMGQFQTCPRGFFFQYIMDWTNTERFHLDYGTAIHAGLEVLTTFIHQGYTDLSRARAIRAFTEEYNARIDDDRAGEAKSYDNGVSALMSYCDNYAVDKTRFECLYTEVSGTVPIADERFMRFRLDALLLDKATNSLVVMDHKTVSWLTQAWQSKWDRAVQVQTYLLALHYLAPMIGVTPGNVVINGIHLRKPLKSGAPNNGFIRIPVGTNDDRLLMAINNLNHWWDQLEWNYEILYQEGPDDEIMNAFPINGEACSHFKCRTGGLCANWINPLARINDIPPDMMYNPPYDEGRTKWKVDLGRDTRLQQITAETADANTENDNDSDD